MRQQLARAAQVRDVVAAKGQGGGRQIAGEVGSGHCVTLSRDQTWSRRRRSGFSRSEGLRNQVWFRLGEAVATALNYRLHSGRNARYFAGSGGRSPILANSANSWSI